MKRSKIESTTTTKKKKKENDESDEIWGESKWIIALCGFFALILFICVASICINDKRRKRLTKALIEKN